jgi:diguanylate cyclase (GGDEF)-like protein/PAS domain S-box-containing protein
MSSISFPDHFAEQFSEYQWIENLARKEAAVIIPLGEWFRDGNHYYEDIPPGIRNEIFFKDEGNGIIHPSALWLLWGFTREDMSDFRWLDKIHPDDRLFLKKRFSEYHSESHSMLSQSVYRVKDSDGYFHWILSSAVAVKRSEEGELYLYIGRDVEINSRIEREAAFRKEIADIETRFARDKALMEAAGLIAGVTTVDALQKAVEEAAVKILNMNDFRFIKASDSHVRVLIGDDLPPNVNADKLSDVSAESGRIRISESYVAWFLGDSADGRIIGMFHQLPGSDDEVLQIMPVLIPIIFRAWEQVDRLEQLRRHATTDPLTKVWNRRAFLQQAGISLRKCIGEGHSATVVIYDIDHFKHVNDVFGHPYGDKILIKTAESMNASLRSEDLMCRWGGEEFVVYLHGVEGEEALMIAERIRESARDATLNEKITVTLSGGVRTINLNNPDTLEKALKLADEALLRAKEDGRNRICRY